MKKIISMIAIFLMLSTLVFAQTEEEVVSMPSNFELTIQNIGENIQLAFTFNAEKKIQLRTEFAERKIEQIQKFTQRMEQTNIDYKKVIEKLQIRREALINKLQKDFGKLDVQQVKRVRQQVQEKLETQNKVMEQVVNQLKELNVNSNLVKRLQKIDSFTESLKKEGRI